MLRPATYTTALLAAARRPDQRAFAEARRAAVSFCTGELLPHAQAEEKALYPAAAQIEQARLLVSGMLAEHWMIAALVEELSAATEPVQAAAAGYALHTLFETHLAKENELLLPVVAADPAVSLATLLDGMHDLLGHRLEPAADGHGTCGCGESDAGVPELDVRSVPHAIRHATVFGAFDAVPPGGSPLLVAPHDRVGSGRGRRA
jgi:hypothetical protein